MKDIAKAIKCEKDFVETVLPKDPTKQFLDYLIEQETGYTSLEDFREDKIAYNFGLANVTYYGFPVDKPIDYETLMANGESFIMRRVQPEWYVTYGLESKADLDWIQSQGILTVPYKSHGGAWLLHEGDYNLSAYIKKEYALADPNYFPKKVVDWLNETSEHTFHLESNNDIMNEDGLKCGGNTFIDMGTHLYYGIGLTLCDHYDMLVKLKMINPDKLPGYIDDITNAQAEEAMEGIFRGINND